jgi:hypothetical protein
MTTAAPNSSVKKKAQALRVFGASVVEEDDDLDYSLAYSMSPQKSGRRNSESSENNENDPHPNVVKVPQRSLTWKADGNDGSSSVNSSFSSLDESDEDKMPTPKAVEARRHQLFQTQRSPMRPDLVRRTQEAIRKATESVNESILAAKFSKEQTRQTKATVSVKSSNEWEEQLQAARDFNNRAQESRLRMLNLRKQLSSKGSREKARRQQAQYSTALAHIEKESQFKSLVYRDHKQRLKDDEEQRRRMSVDTRAKLRVNAIQGKQRMQMQRIEEDNAIIGERHEFSIALREKQTQDANTRRKSYVFRNGDARRIRELHALIEGERQRQQHQDFLLDEDACRDTVEYKRQLEAARRQSFAQRNAHASKQRQQESQELSKQIQEEHESFELKTGAARDADNYQKTLAAERRMSLAGRNDQARHQRIEQNQQMSASLQAEHESYQSKWDGEKDAEAYQAEMAEQRRQSLQSRGQDFLNRRAKTSQLQQMENLNSHASYELKWAGEEDAKDYHELQEKLRRQSLAFRNEQGRQWREKESTLANEALVGSHNSYELKWAGERDASDYQKQLEQERRESFAGRNLHAFGQRKKLSQAESNRQAAEHASYELKWVGEKDAEAYEKKMEQAKRQSLAGRNAEKSRHATVMEELRQIANEKESESYTLKWAGEEDAKAYLKQLDQERRESFQLRGRQAVNARKLEDEIRSEELMKLHQVEALHAADHKDVKEYQAQCAARDRASLEFRGKEDHRQRLEGDEQVTQEQMVARGHFELESLARKDVQEYVKDCKRRRRLSLAFRARETRRHLNWKREQEAKEVKERSRLVHGRLMDQRYVELAQQEEQAEKALEAIRHAHCTFNPFAGLL